ncbi:hypothetical protein PC128_g13066 [Phytophthora cactorum]|nr:hypothetical protein PC128_g13066 [Phytophthora cactorum]
MLRLGAVPCIWKNGNFQVIWWLHDSAFEIIQSRTRRMSGECLNSFTCERSRVHMSIPHLPCLRVCEMSTSALSS